MVNSCRPEHRNQSDCEVALGSVKMRVTNAWSEHKRGNTNAIEKLKKLKPE